jgi:predicted RNase H-like HicB family nuclease
MRTLKFIVERHSDGFVAYPLGLRGIVVGQGDSYDEALSDAQSATKFHIETFGGDVFDAGDDIEAAFVAEGIVEIE